jgi:hypothetical protein
MKIDSIQEVILIASLNDDCLPIIQFIIKTNWIKTMTLLE